MRSHLVSVLGLALATALSAAPSQAREQPAQAEHPQAKKRMNRALAGLVFAAGIAGLLAISRHLSRRAASQDADETVARELREFDERQARALARKRRDEQGAS